MQQELTSILSRLFSAKYNSLADYICQAEPFIDPGAESLLPIIRGIAEDDRLAGEKLAALLRSLGETPRPAVPDPMVAELNYLSIRYLATSLAADLEKTLKEIDSAAEQLVGSGTAASTIRELKELAAKGLERLHAALSQLP